MQGQKGKCKDDIKSYSLDRFEQVERSKTLTQTWPHLMHLEENRCISMIFWHNWTSNIHVSTGECGINQINKFNFQEFSIAKGYVIIVYFGVYLIKSKSNKYLCSIKGRYYLWNSLLTSEQCLHQFCLTNLSLRTKSNKTAN